MRLFQKSLFVLVFTFITLNFSSFCFSAFMDPATEKFMRKAYKYHKEQKMAGNADFLSNINLAASAVFLEKWDEALSIYKELEEEDIKDKELISYFEWLENTIIHFRVGHYNLVEVSSKREKNLYQKSFIKKIGLGGKIFKSIDSLSKAERRRYKKNLRNFNLLLENNDPKRIDEFIAKKQKEKNNPFFMLHVGNMLFDGKNYKGSYFYLNEGLKITGYSENIMPSVYLKLTSSYVNLNASFQGEKVTKDLLSKASNKVPFLYDWAQYRITAQDYEKSVKIYEKIKELDPVLFVLLEKDCEKYKKRIVAQKDFIEKWNVNKDILSRGEIFDYAILSAIVTNNKTKEKIISILGEPDNISDNAKMSGADVGKVYGKNIPGKVKVLEYFYQKGEDGKKEALRVVFKGETMLLHMMGEYKDK